MKKIIPILLVFIVGLACGQWIGNRSWFPKNDATVAVPPDNTDNEPNPEAGSPPPPPTDSIVLFHEILPQMAPAWLLINADQIQATKSSFAAILEQEEIAKIAQDFTAALPQGATQAISDIINDASQSRAFLLPPENPGQLALLFGFAQQDEMIENATLAQNLVEHIAAAFPDSTSSELKAGPYQIRVLQTPLGEYGILCDKGILWLASNPAIFDRIFARPTPPPAENLDLEYMKMLDENPDTALALFINTNYEGPGAILPPGLLPEFLTPPNSSMLSLLFHNTGGSGKLCLRANAQNVPPWLANWSPLQAYPFSIPDPAGLLELAFRWPGPQSATDEISTASNDNTETAAESISPIRTKEVQDKTQEILEEIEFFGPENREHRRFNPERMERFKDQIKVMEQTNPAMAERLTKRIQKREAQASLDRYRNFFLEDMLPAGSEIGINLFGFTNHTPTIAFVIPNRDPELPFLEKIKQTQGIHTSDLQIARLPGLLYRMENKEIADSFGFEELIVLERDGITYLFDNLLSAQNYLKEISSDPEGESRRDPKMRELLENVRQPSQFQTVISNDFFRFILDQEIEFIPKEYPFAEELTACLTKLNEQTKPMVVCAGMHEQEWFIEAYATSDAALILDTVLLGIAIHRFVGF